MHHTLIAIVLVSMLVLAACSQPSEQGASAPDTTTTSERVQTPSIPPTEPTVPTSVMPDDDLGAEDTGVPSGCVALTDFETAAGQEQWLTVNDDVMGGRSDGGVSFADGQLVFEGVINTNGGGFSSLRLPINVGTMTNATSIMIQAVPDERLYTLTLDDQLEDRDRRVSHRAPINFSPIEPGTADSAVTLVFEDFVPAIFGQVVDDEPVRPDLVDELGLMISDGRDGPFRLEVMWIASCS